MTADPEKEGLDRKVNRAYKGARYASVGIEFGVSVVIGYALGAWLEQKFDFAPWGTIGGVLVGFAAGVKSLLHTSQVIIREQDREAAEAAAERAAQKAEAQEADAERRDKR